MACGEDLQKSNCWVFINHHVGMLDLNSARFCHYGNVYEIVNDLSSVRSIISTDDFGASLGFNDPLDPSVNPSGRSTDVSSGS